MLALTLRQEHIAILSVNHLTAYYIVYGLLSGNKYYMNKTTSHRSGARYNMTTSAKQLKVTYVIYGLLIGSDFFLNQGTELHSEYMCYHLNLLTEQKLMDYIKK